MIWLSEILMREHELANFADLKVSVRRRAADGERFFGFDIKPEFPDTPDNWQDVLESIFTAWTTRL